jgi:hypothetical protein
MTVPVLGVDTIQIGGVPAPGQWILQPTHREFGWQIQKGFGISGATIFPIGDELLVASFLIRLWDVHPASPTNQYPAFTLFASLYLKKATFSVGGGLTGFALGINHPELARLGAKSFVVRKSPSLTNNGRGTWTGVCEFVEYRKPKPALSKPAAALRGK